MVFIVKHFNKRIEGKVQHTTSVAVTNPVSVLRALTTTNYKDLDQWTAIHLREIKPLNFDIM